MASAAMARRPMIIRPHGSFLQVDADGYLINDCTTQAFHAEWRDVLSETLRWYQEQLSADLHSVWVRGSVVQGDTAVAAKRRDELEKPYLYFCALRSA
jgi:hypothetical protein